MLRFEKFKNVTEKGDYLSTINDIREKPNIYGKNSLFLYNMDIGMLYHYAGVYDSSTTYLLKAAQMYDDLFTRSVTNEAASILINDNVRPYRSKPYEITLLHQVLQFNYLSQQQSDEALVEARSVQLFFNEWERKNEKSNRYFTDGMFHYVTSMVYDEQGQTDDAMISLFKAVQAYQLGPVTLPRAVSDYAYCMFQKNSRTMDIDRLKLRPIGGKTTMSAVKTENEQTEIVFIGYAGKGPALIENEWWGNWIKDGLLVLHHSASDGRQETMTLPAPSAVDNGKHQSHDGGKTKSGTTLFIKVALPKVKTYSSQTAYFTIDAGTGLAPAATYTIQDFDQQMEKQLQDAQPSIALRTIARVVTRTIAAQQAKKKMETESPIANLLINLGTDILSSQLEKADTRCCFFIPKTVQIARMSVPPGEHSIVVSAHDNRGKVLSSKTFDGIMVKPKKKAFVFYSSFK